MPLLQKMPIAAARSVLTIALAAPKADHTMVTISWAGAPNKSMNSRTKSSPPAHTQKDDKHGDTRLRGGAPEVNQIFLARKKQKIQHKAERLEGSRRAAQRHFRIKVWSGRATIQKRWDVDHTGYKRATDGRDNIREDDRMVATTLGKMTAMRCKTNVDPHTKIHEYTNVQ